jgi:LETM1 and EF-hand domain-containing protein 1
VNSTLDIIKNPQETWDLIKSTAHHYWVGTKLLWEEMKMAAQILRRVLQGSAMSRRERLQLMRTTMDMFRLIPFAIFVIVPFMEFLLPFALRLFPNMLPSTFQVSFRS